MFHYETVLFAAINENIVWRFIHIVAFIYHRPVLSCNLLWWHISLLLRGKRWFYLLLARSTPRSFILNIIWLSQYAAADLQYLMRPFLGVMKCIDAVPFRRLFSFEIFWLIAFHPFDGVWHCKDTKQVLNLFYCVYLSNGTQNKGEKESISVAEKLNVNTNSYNKLIQFLFVDWHF